MTCKVCEKKKFALGYCTKHYQQFKKYGKIPERNERTPNKIIKYKDYAEVLLYNSKQEEVARVKIDLSDIEKISKIKWGLDNGYARSHVNRQLMHRFITNAEYLYVVDHINHNTLDNRKSNLRIVDEFINQIHKRTRKRGIRKTRNGKKYQARIRCKNKEYHLGHFDTYEEAIDARKQAEIQYFGKEYTL